MRMTVVGALGHLIELACHEIDHSVHGDNLVLVHRTLEPDVLLSLDVHVEQLVDSELPKHVLAQWLLLEARPESVEDLVEVKAKVLAEGNLSDDLCLASD